MTSCGFGQSEYFLIALIVKNSKTLPVTQEGSHWGRHFNWYYRCFARCFFMRVCWNRPVLERQVKGILWIYPPPRMPVNTRIITCLVGNLYTFLEKPVLLGNRSKVDSHPKPITPRYTLPETNIAPENGWLEYVGILVSFWDGLFSGAMLVLGRVLQVKNVPEESIVKLCSHCRVFGKNHVVRKLSIELAWCFRSVPNSINSRLKQHILDYLISRHFPSSSCQQDSSCISFNPKTMDPEFAVNNERSGKCAEHIELAASTTSMA